MDFQMFVCGGLMRNSFAFSRRQWIRSAAALLMVGTAFAWTSMEIRSQGHSAETRSGEKAVAPATAEEERIQKIEATAVDIPMGDKEPLRLSLRQLMELYNVPAVSVAVIEDSRISWAKGYGTIGAGSTAPVTTKTLFQAGSISKPVAATG